MKLINAKIWISKNASLCRGFANHVTHYIHLLAATLVVIPQGK